MKINLKNIGDLILSDKQVMRLLPDHSHHFDAWKLGTMVPSLRPTAKKAALDLLEALTEDNVKVLENHFGEHVVVESISYNIVKTFEIDISELEFELPKYEGFQVCLSTDGDKATVTLWR